MLQHAHNPVMWRPWNPQTWEKAIQENKLVIVSIGYSTCHWCHVMEHESFEDEQTALLMNQYFICIKVDREERPDIDMVYMDACQLTTGRGGWPLNAICLPNMKPIFAGTYFPRDQWNSILLQLSQMHANTPDKLVEQATKIENGLKQMSLIEFQNKPKIKRSDLETMALKCEADFDLDHGGLKRNQKFPMPAVFEYLYDEYLISGQKSILEFANFTLLKMANGGIYDHVRGGFYRYTVDPYWFAPHFEKMLYDNSQLISLYARAFSITNADFYKTVVEETIEFALRELKSPEGGYYSALDADSSGEEGAYYVFSWSELKDNLSPDLLDLAVLVYNVKEHGNWEHGRNILSKAMSPLQLIEATKMDFQTLNVQLKKIKQALFDIQAKRERPGLDNKFICSWNAMMLAALAHAGRYLQNEVYVNQAQQLATWMLEHFIPNEGGLKRTAFGNNIEAFSEDYATFILGLIALYEADGDSQWLDAADKFAAFAIENHYDHEKQLFAFTSVKSPQIIVRKFDITDDVIPSANAILAIALQKLGILNHKMAYFDMGKGMITSVREQVLNAPIWHSCWAKAAQSEALGLLQISLNERLPSAEMNQLQQVLPSWATLAVLPQSDSKVPAVALKEKMTDNRPIHICLDMTCFEPVSQLDQALEIIEDVLLP